MGIDPEPLTSKESGVWEPDIRSWRLLEWATARHVRSGADPAIVPF